MVSRVLSEIMLIALTVSALGFISLSLLLQQQALTEALVRNNIIVSLNYVTCNASAILVYNYGYEDVEVREVYVNSTKTQFTLLIYDPTSKSWSQSTSSSTAASSINSVNLVNPQAAPTPPIPPPVPPPIPPTPPPTPPTPPPTPPPSPPPSTSTPPPTYPTIPARRLALIMIPNANLTTSTTITLVTNKGVWSHTCS